MATIIYSYISLFKYPLLHFVKNMKYFPQLFPIYNTLLFCFEKKTNYQQKFLYKLNIIRRDNQLPVINGMGKEELASEHSSGLDNKHSFQLLLISDFLLSPTLSTLLSQNTVTPGSILSSGVRAVLSTLPFFPLNSVP